MVAFPPDRTGTWLRAIEECDPVEVRGRITRVVGLLVESSGPAAGIGELCALAAGDALFGMAEVVGFREGTTLLMPLGSMEGIRPGLEVVATGTPLLALQSSAFQVEHQIQNIKVLFLYRENLNL